MSGTWIPGKSYADAHDWNIEYESRKTAALYAELEAKILRAFVAEVDKRAKTSPKNCCYVDAFVEEAEKLIKEYK